jgi:hypothetical protein
MSLTNWKCVEMEVQIKHGSHWEYPVAVLDSPEGEAQGTLQFPLGATALEGYLETLQTTLLYTGQKPSKKQTQQEAAVQDFGSKLFEALFSGDVRTCYDSARDQAEKERRMLRLKLHIQPQEMAALPWEYLYDSERFEYLCPSDRVLVLRSFEAPGAASAGRLPPPLRVLAIVPSPGDLPALDVEKERQRLEIATALLQERELIELTWVEGQSWNELQSAFQEGPWHVFVFVGYGGCDRDTDRGYVVLADSAGNTYPLSATRLSNLLSRHDPLQLVVLVGRQERPDNEPDRFSRTATMLVQQGVPSVLVMQHDVAEGATDAFAQTFYPALGMGDPLSHAVKAARQAMLSASPQTPAWGTLALYTRQSDLRPLEKESLVTASIERGDEALATEDFQRATTQFELTADLGAGEAVAGRLVLVEVVRRTLEEAQEILNRLTGGEEIEADTIAETVENLEEIGRKVPDSRAVQVLLPRIQSEASAYRDRLWQDGLALIRGKTVGLTLGQRYRNAEEGVRLLAKAQEVDWEHTSALSDDLANARRRLAYLETARAKANARRKRRLVMLGIIVFGLIGILLVLAYNSGLVSMPTFVAETRATSVAETEPVAATTTALGQAAEPTDVPGQTADAATPSDLTGMPAAKTVKAPTPTLAPQTQATRTAVSGPENTATSRPGTAATSRSESTTTAQPTPSTTPATTVTASPIRTPSPTPRSSATASPSTTPSTVPSGSPTAEPATASPVPTRRPSPTPTPTAGIIYPAPVLLEPDDGAYIRQSNVSSLHPLRWEWAGTLRENEWFDIRVWKVGTPHYGIAWTKEKEYLYDSCLQTGGSYRWSIAVIRGEAGEWQGNLSPEATPHWFASDRSDSWCRDRGRFMMPPRIDGIQ